MVAIIVCNYQAWCFIADVPVCLSTVCTLSLIVVTFEQSIGWFLSPDQCFFSQHAIMQHTGSFFVQQAVVLLGLVFSVLSQEIGWEEHLRNDVFLCRVGH